MTGAPGATPRQRRARLGLALVSWAAVLCWGRPPDMALAHGRVEVPSGAVLSVRLNESPDLPSLRTGSELTATLTAELNTPSARVAPAGARAVVVVAADRERARPEVSAVRISIEGRLRTFTIEPLALQPGKLVYGLRTSGSVSVTLASAGHGAPGGVQRETDEPARAGATVTIQAGAAILARTLTPIPADAGSAALFIATLAKDLVAGGVVVARAGTRAYGRALGNGGTDRTDGGRRLKLTMTQINLDGDRTVLRVQTDPLEVAAASGDAGNVAAGTLLRFVVHAPVEVQLRKAGKEEDPS